MQDFRTRFLQLALERNVLRFGQFALKSGRVSPYFFNAGLFSSGAALEQLGQCYAQAIVSAGLEFDMLFGPAYKGIPLASVTATALFREHHLDIPFAYNRKEVKDHGEGGVIAGAPLQGRVAIIDDVITAGTAIREALEIIGATGARPAGVIIALDRQERGQGKASAVQEIERLHKIPVISIATVSHLVALLEATGKTAELEAMQGYQAQYGI